MIMIYVVSKILFPVKQMDGCGGGMAGLGQHSTDRPGFLKQEVAPDENVLNYCAAHLKGK